MKITILSEIDYAGSGYRLAEALQLTGFDIKFFSGKYVNKYNLPQSARTAKKIIQERVNQSDIIHLKGDFPPKDIYLGVNIKNKPIIVSVSGSHFRMKKYWGYGKYNISQYSTAKIRTAFTPDLLYEGFSRSWTPHTVDSISKPNVWCRQPHPVLMHTPTSKERKDTAFVQAVFSKLSRRMKIETLIFDNMTQQEVIKARRYATIFFDQFRVGFYGNSAIEAMQYGIHVAAWISPFAHQRANLIECPVISGVKSVDIWAKRLEQIIDGNLEGLSIKTKQWCDKVHSYQAVSKLWKGIYESV
jgi:hypothetical protein